MSSPSGSDGSTEDAAPATSGLSSAPEQHAVGLVVVRDEQRHQARHERHRHTMVRGAASDLRASRAPPGAGRGRPPRPRADAHEDTARHQQGGHQDTERDRRCQREDQWHDRGERTPVPSASQAAAAVARKPIRKGTSITCPLGSTGGTVLTSVVGALNASANTRLMVSTVGTR